MTQQINLFNPIFLKQKRTFSALNMLEALGLLLIGVLVFYGYANFDTTTLAAKAEETARQYNQSRLQLAQTSAHYAPKKADAALEAEVNNVQARFDARKATLNNLGIGVLTNDTGYAEYLRALARQSLRGLWLTGFKVGRGGAEMEIVGRALQPELVPSYIHRLNQERALQGRAFDSLSMAQRQDALPADASRPAGAPVAYSYTEFRLGSSHAELPPGVRVEPAVPAAAGQPQGDVAPGSQQPAQTPGSGPR